MQSLQTLREFVEAFSLSRTKELEMVLKGAKGDLRSISYPSFKLLYESLVARANEDEKKSSEGLVSHGEKTYVDVFYANSIRGRFIPGQRVRFMQKTPIARVDTESPHSPVIMRFNLKEERPMPIRYAPKDAPLFFRQAIRWTFVYKERYAYTLTKVSSGPTKEVAAKMMPVFEIELELLASRWQRDTSIEKIARDMWGKSVDLLGIASEHRDQVNLLEPVSFFVPSRKNVQKRKRQPVKKSDEPTKTQRKRQARKTKSVKKKTEQKDVEKVAGKEK
jgi:hypothetical protein